MEQKKYLVDDEEREQHAVRCFSRFALERLLSTNPKFADGKWWAIQNFQKERLSAKGDIDLLVGRYELDGVWPVPTCDVLIGFEVKCVFRDLGSSNSPFKSTKRGNGKATRLNGQLDWLDKSGFDWTYYLEIIANPPSGSTNGNGIGAWFNASNQALESSKLAMSELGRDYSGLASIGHLRFSIGSVLGGVESMRGSFGPLDLIRPAKENADLKSKYRQRLAAIIKATLPPNNHEDVFGHSMPRFFFDNGKSIEDQTNSVFGVPFHTPMRPTEWDRSSH
jgi:hypothetical protein